MVEVKIRMLLLCLNYRALLTAKKNWQRRVKTENQDGFEDEDGCPDLDNDLDGLPDMNDQCPNAAETFNGLSREAWDSAGFGVILAIAIALIGHLLNLILSIMSGAIHGLRLNCIEFFKWSLPEDGFMFSAFAKKGKQA